MIRQIKQSASTWLMRKGLITLCWHRQMPLYIFSLRSRRLSHEIENDPFEEIYSKHELLSHSDDEKICSFIFMKLLKKHFIFVSELQQWLSFIGYVLNTPMYVFSVFRLNQTKKVYEMLKYYYISKTRCDCDPWIGEYLV